MKNVKQINDLIEKETKGRISVLEYTGSDSSIVIRCNVCNTTKTRKSFRKSDVVKSVCFNCRQKKDFAEKEEKYKNLLKNTEYELLDHYKGSNEKLRFKHKKCGLIFEQIPYKPEKLNCTECVDGKPKIEIAQEDLNSKYNGDYIIESYVNRTELTVKHKCGTMKKTTMKTMLQQENKCHCEGGRKTYNKEDLEKIFKENYGEDYELLDSFKKHKHRYYIVLHKKCGTISKKRKENLIEGRKCRECSLLEQFPNMMKNNEDFNKKLLEEHDGLEYELQGDYISTLKKVCLLHKKCGKQFKVTPANFFYNTKTRCPHCRGTISKGELKIEKALLKRGVEFQYQYYLDDCTNPKTNRKLPFDFALLRDDELIALIEYDGKQHFAPVPRFGGEEKLRSQQNLDRVKDHYCKENQIKLFRIHYKKFNKIDQEIDHILKNTVR